MPLIPCPDCDRYISIEARSCPHCGCYFRPARPAADNRSAQKAELKELYESMLDSSEWVSCRRCGELKRWNLTCCPNCYEDYSEEDCEFMHREKQVKIRQKDAISCNGCALAVGIVILIWVSYAGFSLFSVFALLFLLACMLTMHARGFPGTRSKSAVALIIFTVIAGAVNFNHKLDEKRAQAEAERVRKEEERVRMEVGRNYIGEEKSYFDGYYKTVDSDDGRRFKIKMPLREKNYYGLKAEQVSVVVSGKSRGETDYQTVTFYDANAAADKLFDTLEAVLTSNYKTPGQPSQAACGKTLVWRNGDLTFILQKSKSNAPNHYLVTLTAKTSQPD